jgi:inhibitor of KinA sporulation pathway (predicted exonuclease)
VTANQQHPEKKKTAPVQAGRSDINHLEGIEMHYQLSSDDLGTEIGDLIEQYGAGRTGFGVFTVQRLAYDGSWHAALHVDERFTGEHVEVLETTEHTHRIIRARGLDLYEALRLVRTRFLEAAPVEIAKGA